MINIKGKNHTVDSLTLGQCLQVYLMTSYQYYHRYNSLISDGDFDAIGKRLLSSWEDFEHQHKHLVSLCDLKAGTLFALPSKQYPTVVVVASDDWARDQYSGVCK